MGEARRRGTYVERRAYALARRMAWDKQQAEERERLRIERRRIASERQKLLTPQQRKEAVLTTELLHALIGAAAFAAPPLYAVKRRP